MLFSYVLVKLVSLIKEVRIIRINRLAALTGLIIIVVSLVGTSLVHANIVTSKIDYLQQQVEVEQNNKRNIERQKLELEKNNTELNDKSKSLEQQNTDKDKKIEELNNQLQAKIAEKQRIAAVKAEQALVPTAYADAPVSTDSAKAFIYEKESGNNPGSINKSSGACGLGQALPCSKMPCSLSDYACQDAYFTSYMAGRYGTWENARAFWIANRWW